MPKVYSYIRFSSKAQASGDSLRRQTAETERWAKAHGYELDESLSYRDLGVSAFDRTNLRSGALGLFLRAAQEGKIERGSILAIEALDRLTRAEPLDAFRLLSDLVDQGISIATVSDGRIYSESSLNGDFASLMLAAALLVRGHEESKRKSERLKASYSAKREAKAGRIGHGAPHWLRPEGDRWALVPEHAQTVRDIFEMSAAGMGVTTIALQFNDTKRPLMNDGRSSTGWHASRIGRLLRNRAVIGEYQPHSISKDSERVLAGEPIAGHYPAAIPEDLFWRVQAKLSERLHRKDGHRRDSGYRNFLGGMLTCGYCGAKMYLDRKGHKEKEGESPVAYYYYGCSLAVRHVTNCQNRVNYLALLLGAEARTFGRHPRPMRFGMMPALFEHLLMRGEQLNAGAEEAREAARQRHRALSEQLSNVEVRKTKLIDSLESGLLTPAEVQPRLDKIRLEMKDFEAQMTEALEAMQSAPSQSRMWLDDALMEQMDRLIPMIKDVTQIEERAAFRVQLSQIVDRIYVYRDCARVKLHHDDALLVLPLAETADISTPEKSYPLPDLR